MGKDPQPGKGHCLQALSPTRGVLFMRPLHQRSVPSAAASQRVELTANQAGSSEPSHLSGAQEVKREYERCRAPIKNLRPPSNFRAFIFQ